MLPTPLWGKKQTFCFHENIDPPSSSIVHEKNIGSHPNVLQVVFYSQKNRQFPVFNPFDCWINHHISWCIPTATRQGTAPRWDPRCSPPGSAGSSRRTRGTSRCGPPKPLGERRSRGKSGGNPPWNLGKMPKTRANLGKTWKKNMNMMKSMLGIARSWLSGNIWKYGKHGKPTWQQRTWTVWQSLDRWTSGKLGSLPLNLTFKWWKMVEMIKS